MIKWKKHKNLWRGSIGKESVGTIFINKLGSYSITFLRGNEWAACFKTEASLETAKRMVEAYYEIHKEN